MKFLQVFFIMTAIMIQVTISVKGIDLADSSNNFSCMKQNGMSFGITRGYCSYGAVDANGVQNLKNIRAAGMVADVYFFPCRGKDASTQAREFMNYYDSRGLESEDEKELVQNGSEDFKGMKAGLLDSVMEQQVKVEFLQTESEQIELWYQPQEVLGQLYGTIWIDVETNPSSGCSWNGYSGQSNCNFLITLVNALKAQGKLVGIYSSYYNWEDIFGSSGACTNLSGNPIWYAHYDNNPSFSDWRSFGGWTKPTIKQYLGDTTLCGYDVDLNVY